MISGNLAFRVTVLYIETGKTVTCVKCGEKLAEGKYVIMFKLVHEERIRLVADNPKQCCGELSLPPLVFNSYRQAEDERIKIRDYIAGANAIAVPLIDP